MRALSSFRMLLLIATVSAACASTGSQAPERLAPAPRKATPPTVMKAPTEECEELLSVVMPFAEQMLQKNREFFPFGATMSAAGQISPAAAAPGGEHPDSAAVIALLEQGFRQAASTGAIRASAAVVDVRTTRPKSAIEVRLDHRDGYSVRVLFPYSFSATGHLAIEQPLAIPGENSVFAR